MNVVDLPIRVWAKSLGGKRLKARHPPSRLSALWFRRNGPLRAHVDLQGALILEHNLPLPLWVMRDLARARIVYVDGRFTPEKDLPDRQFLSQWLKQGARSDSLEFHRPENLQAPLATSLFLIIMDEGSSQEVCYVPYYPDERLLQLHRPQTSGGLSTQH